MAGTSQIFSVRASRRGLQEITGQVAAVVGESDVLDGMCNVFLPHTSASLTINENADPSARADLESFLDRLVPENASWYTHTTEGPDDMPSHIKCILTQVSLNVPVRGGRLALGTWQGLYLWEHRDRPSARQLIVTVF